MSAELDGLIRAALAGVPPEDGVLVGQTGESWWVAGLPQLGMGELLLQGGAPVAVVKGLGVALVEAAPLGPALPPRARLRGAGRLPGIPTGAALLGRVVDPLGRPLDGGPAPVGAVAPWMPGSVARRGPAEGRLPSGTAAIDLLAPLRRGRSTVLVGARSRGKSTLALTAVRAQAHDGGADAVVYVHVGNSAASLGVRRGRLAGIEGRVAQVAALAGSPVALREGAPLAGMALAEALAAGGAQVLVVVDELATTDAPTPGLLRAVRSLFSRVGAVGAGAVSLFVVGAAPGADLSAPLPTELLLLADQALILDEERWALGARPALGAPLGLGGGALAAAVATGGRVEALEQGPLDCLGPAAVGLRGRCWARLAGLDPAVGAALRQRLDGAADALTAEIAAGLGGAALDRRLDALLALRA